MVDRLAATAAVFVLVYLVLTLVSYVTEAPWTPEMITRVRGQFTGILIIVFLLIIHSVWVALRDKD